MLDLQEQVKGALIARIARGVRHGPDRASIREPVATLAARRASRDRSRPASDRPLPRSSPRPRSAIALEGPPRFGLVPPPAAAGAPMPDRPYVVFAARDEPRRQAVAGGALARADRARSRAAGFAVVLPWGSARRARAQRAPRRAAKPARSVPPRQTLPALATLLARAELVVGVDTGLVHLAAALGTPTVSLFVATDPRSRGVERASARARDLGGVGVVPDASTTSRTRPARCCGARRAADATR